MSKVYFLTEEFYKSFKTAFLRKNKFSELADDASSFAYEKFLQKLKDNIFENELCAYKYLWKTATRKLHLDLKR